MKNVSGILNQIDKHSLVIMDELGSKTDPMEGEALAKAIIEYIFLEDIFDMQNEDLTDYKSRLQEYLQVIRR